jgi:hypothetical protein
MQWLRKPPVHFVVIGAALFALQTWLRTPPAPEKAAIRRDPIVITAAQIEGIRANFTRQTGLAPTPEDEVALIEDAIEDELLYREALARGLDRGDRSVSWRLTEKMRFLSDDQTQQDDAELYRQARELGMDRDDVVIRRILIQKMRLLAALPAAAEEPSDTVLQNYLDRHRDRYRQPARVSLWHVFLSREKRGDTLARDAENVLALLSAETTVPERAIELGDHFPLAHHFRSSSRHHLEKIFGPRFAEGVMRLEPRSWSGPIPSAYGLHLVWAESKTAATLPSLESVRRQVTLQFRAESRQRRLEEMLRRLRRQYEVRVESATHASRGGL